jgi:3',5'-cyclic AMP phosphodiesterase CpdA
MSESAAVRLAHISDVHFTAKPLGWKGRDLVSKRVTGWMNVTMLGRGYRFRHATTVAAVLTGELKERSFDHLIFTGDATALGFESEFAKAAKLLGIGDPAMPPGLAVPGNHDCYVKKPVRERLFERYFGPWQRGEREDGETYPFAQKVGPLWLIGVNSSTYNILTFDATGRVGAPQRERLRRLLAKLPQGPRVLVTHYPYAVRSGKPEPRWHRLHDWRETAKIAAEGGVRLWLHGHRHRPYLLTAHKEIPFPSICGGSATQTGLWGYHDYTFENGVLTAVRRAYDPKTKAFTDRETFQLDLAGK